MDERLLMACDFAPADSVENARLEIATATVSGDVIHFATIDSEDDLQFWQSRREDSTTVKTAEIVGADVKFIQDLVPHNEGFFFGLERSTGEHEGVFELRYLDTSDCRIDIAKNLGSTLSSPFHGINRQVSFNKLGDHLLITAGIYEPDVGVADIFLSDNLETPFANFEEVFSTPATRFVELEGVGFFFDDRDIWGSDYSLVRVDPTVPEASRVKPIPTETLSRPFGLTAAGGKLYFFATTEEYVQLWVSDGTADHTHVIHDFPRPAGNLVISNPQGLTEAVDGVLFQITIDGETQIWKSDGTAEGTAALPENDARSSLISVGGYLDAFLFDSETYALDSLFARLRGGIFFNETDGELWAQSVSSGYVLNLGTGLRLVGDTDSSAFLAKDNKLFELNANTLQLSLVAEVGRSSQDVNAADINQDGLVDFADFLVLSSNYGQATDDGLIEGDLDLDGRINFSDFLILMANFGRFA